MFGAVGDHAVSIGNLMAVGHFLEPKPHVCLSCQSLSKAKKVILPGSWTWLPKYVVATGERKEDIGVTCGSRWR